MAFREIGAKEIPGNLIRMIADEWMLVTAGAPQDYNMMTASWGGMGEMWGRDVAVTVVRPQRYTYGFLEREERFTLSFYGDQREIHQICGSKSGRDVDKTRETGLIPVVENGAVFFEQARLALVCRKLYAQDLDPACFLDKSCLESYRAGDFHRVYVGEIERVFLRDE